MKHSIIAIALMSACLVAHAQGGFFKAPPAAPVAQPAPVAAPVATPTAPVAEPRKKSLEELAEESMLHQHVIDESRKWPWPEPLAVREGRRYPAVVVLTPPRPATVASAAPVVPSAAAKPAAKAKPAPAPADPIGDLIQSGKVVADKAVAVIVPQPSTTPAPVPVNKPAPAAGPNQLCKREGGITAGLASWNCMRKACVGGDYYDHPHCKAWMSTRHEREIAQ